MINPLKIKAWITRKRIESAVNIRRSRQEFHSMEDEIMETHIGYVTHYYNHISVAIISLTGRLNTNDTLHFLGRSSDFYQKAWSMEIDHHQVKSVEPGKLVALKVADQVHKGDTVFLVTQTTPEETREILIEQLRAWEK